MSPLEVRPDLAEVAPYVSPQRPGWTGLRMNTNESPYPPPPAVVDRFLSSMREAAFNRYPDRDARSLVSALAEHVDHPPEGVWLTNGSNEAFLHLFLAFGGRERSIMVFEPTYSLHSLDRSHHRHRSEADRARRGVRGRPGTGLGGDRSSPAGRRGALLAQQPNGEHGAEGDHRGSARACSGTGRSRRGLRGVRSTRDERARSPALRSETRRRKDVL